MDKKNVTILGVVLLVIVIVIAIYSATNKVSESPNSPSTSISDEGKKQVMTDTEDDQQQVLTQKLQYCSRTLVVQKMDVEGVDIVDRILQLTAKDASEGSVCKNLIANLGSSNEVRVKKDIQENFVTFSLGTDGSGEWTYGIVEFTLRDNVLYSVGAFDGAENEIGTLK